jgi:DNA damage-inducible protein 1
MSPLTSDSIPVEVNGHPIKAFVDSGAQQTIGEHAFDCDARSDRVSVSPECAEACG